MSTYKLGDLVWAKMKGFPKWPGVVAEPSKDLKVTKKGNNYCIFFFGSNNFAWIEPKSLEPYNEPADSKKKSGTFKDALAAIEHYKLTGEGGPPMEGDTTDSFDQLIRPSPSVSTGASSEKKIRNTSAKRRRISKDDSTTAATTEEDASSDDGVPRSVKSLKARAPKKSTDSTPKTRAPRLSYSSQIKRNKMAENYAADTTTTTTEGAAATSSSNRKSLLDRHYLPPTESPPLDLNTVSQTLLSKSVVASDKIFGFLGLGIMGSDVPSCWVVLKRMSDDEISKWISPQEAWIEPKSLEPYNEPADSKKKSGTFKDALAAIEHYKLTGEGGPPMEGDTTDSFDQLIRPSPSVSTGASSEKKIRNTSAKRRRISKDDSTTAATTEEDASSDDGVPRSVKSLKARAPKKSTDSTPKTRAPRLSYSSQIKRNKMAENYAADTTTTTTEGAAATSSSNRKSLLDRHYLPPTESPPLDLNTVSQTLLSKSVVASDKIFGFLGLGIMGSGMVKNLLNSGHDVHVWDRSPEARQEFARIGATPQITPSDVIHNADITFSCVADPPAAKELVFRNCGVLKEMDTSKTFVEMSGIDPETSMTIATACHETGGRYLEAMVIGSRPEADEGTLIILTAGDRSAFNDVSSCFEAVSRVSLYLGEVGAATKMHLIHQMYMGTTLASLAESMSMADRAGLNQSEVLEILSVSNVCSPFMVEKGRNMADCTFTTRFPLRHLQKDMKLVQGLSESLDQPIPVASAANEVYKHARRFGYGDHDASAVYISAWF